MLSSVDVAEEYIVEGLGLSVLLATPKPVVELPWGSESTSSTFKSLAASERQD